MIKTDRNRRPVGALVFLLLASALASGCPKPNGKFWFWKKTDPKTKEFISRIQQKTAPVNRIDASVEINLESPSSPLQGKYYGSLQLDRRGDKVAYQIQAYNVLNAPVMEIIADRERVEIFSPLDKTLYLNFTDLLPAAPQKTLPMSMFCQMTIPVDLLSRQIELLLGQGFSDDRYYQLTEEGGRYCLSEQEGLIMKRKIFFSTDAGNLLAVVAYDKGAPAGKIDFSNHVGGTEPHHFFPQRIELTEGPNRVTMSLSRFRVNENVKSPIIAFRPPAGETVVLLTPSAP